MLAVWLLFAFSFSLILTHIVAYATDVGISTMQASMVVSIIGGLSMLSRLITGRISDIVGRKVPAVTCAVLNAGALIWLIWSHNLGTLYLFAVVFGFSWGGFGVAVLSVAGDTFVGRSLGTIMGTLEVGFALGSAMGPALGGFVFDMTGSYLLAFATAAVGMLIAGVLITLTRPQTKTPTKGKHFLLTKI
jgi:MFS family permease